jgi:hypothetical protein
MVRSVVPVSICIMYYVLCIVRYVLGVADVVTGGLTGVAMQLVIFPIDTLKARIMMADARTTTTTTAASTTTTTTSIYGAAVRLVKQRGIVGLYRGASVVFIKAFAMNAAGWYVHVHAHVHVHVHVHVRCRVEYYRVYKNKIACRRMWCCVISFRVVSCRVVLVACRNGVYSHSHSHSHVCHRPVLHWAQRILGVDIVAS